MKAICILVVLSVFGANAASGQTSLPTITREAAQQIVENYLRTWSTDVGVNRTSMERFYASRVIYYGKSMSRDDVLRDKLNYIAVWPERHYALVPQTISITCDRLQTACVVSGLMQWNRRSASGMRSVGATRLRLTVDAASRGRIVRESAR